MAGPPAAIGAIPEVNSMKGSRFVALLRAALASLAMLALTAGVAQASSGIFAGEPVAVGQGHARVLVVTGTGGTPTSVHVVLDDRALEGLPADRSDQHTWAYVLPMPTTGPRTGYDHVGLDWEAAGHPPNGVYTVPHFDVHFYLIGSAEQDAVTFNGPDRERMLAPPDASLVPPGYAVPPDTAVERMGLHGIDLAGGEFHGKPFTHSFLYGYYAGRLVFVEPMITLAFLRANGDVTAPVRTPSAYSLPGYYPTRYRVGYDRDRKEYHVALLGLRPWGMPATASR